MYEALRRTVRPKERRPASLQRRRWHEGRPIPGRAQGRGVGDYEDWTVPS